MDFEHNTFIKPRTRTKLAERAFSSGMCCQPT